MNTIESNLDAALAAQTPAQINAKKPPVCGAINAEVASGTVKQGKGPSKMKAGTLFKLLPVFGSLLFVGKSQTRRRTNEEIKALAGKAVKEGTLDSTNPMAIHQFVADNMEVVISGGIQTLADWAEKAPETELYFTLGGVKEAVAGLLRDALDYVGE